MNVSMCVCACVHVSVHACMCTCVGVSSKCLPRSLPFFLLSAALLLALSPSPGKRGSCVWLPNNNREGEEVFKEVQMINEFSCIILTFFLRSCPLCPVQKIMEVNFF